MLLAGCEATGKPSAAPTATVAQSPTVAPSSSPASVVRPTPSARPSPTAHHPSYPWRVRRVVAADLPHSWHPGCPVAPDRLRMLTLRYVGFDGRRHTGRLVVQARAVEDVVQVFRTLDAQRFPIRSLRPVDDFGGSDDASMAADNTSAFNCRQAVGGSGWSAHAYGLALDLNPRENPYLLGGRVMPPEGAAYVHRSPARRGMVVKGGVPWRAFTAVGWKWGGRWEGTPDYQHFSQTGG